MNLFQSGSGSDSEGEGSNTDARRRVLATLPAEVDTSNKKNALYERPMYSLNQVHFSFKLLFVL